MTTEEVERIKLEDGIRLHESVKVELETYARETGNPIVKPSCSSSREILHTPLNSRRSLSLTISSMGATRPRRSKWTPVGLGRRKRR